MKYLGIDYGTKKIGLAQSDDQGTIAFPLKIIPSDANTLSVIQQIIKDNRIDHIVVGYSVQGNGDDNIITPQIQEFIKKLKIETSIPISLQNEWGSTLAAQSFLYGKGNIAQQRWTGKTNSKKRADADAGAAAIILQRFLDRSSSQ